MDAPSPSGASRAISVLPDLAGVDKRFTYLVPAGLTVRAGMIVRINLAHRRVRAWVLDDDVEAPDDLVCKPIEGVVSLALDPARIGLANFAAWRYAGRLRPFLLAGSPERIVVAGDLPRNSRRPTQPRVELDLADPVIEATRDLLAAGGGVLQLPPNASRLGVVECCVEVLRERPGMGRDLLVMVPEHRDAETLARHLGRLGYSYALLPDDFARAYLGGTVVIGTRNAAFGPVGDLGGIVVLDAHATSYVDQRAPTWNAAVIANERAAAAGVPAILVSPCPPLALTGTRPPAGLARAYERAHWPAIEIVDRRGDDPRAGLYASALAELIRQALARDHRPVVCLLNRTGRLRLLACSSCGEIARCEHCAAPMRQYERAKEGDALLLTCSRCARTRPVICASCRGGTLKTLRVGASRAAEELSALIGVPTALLTKEHGDGRASGARVVVGTEAVVHRVRAASLVVFLDFDQHLFVPRFGAAEEALALLASAGRLVGARGVANAGGFARRLVLQTRLPDHEVLQAALAGDPSLVRVAELVRRGELNLPPVSSMALISGESAGQLVTGLRGLDDLEVIPLDEPGPAGGRAAAVRYLVRSTSSEVLCTALAGAGAPRPGLRIEMDPTDL